MATELDQRYTQIQHRATKYILNDYTICYRAQLIKLKLLSLMYLFELQDILFAVKSIKTPTNHFNYIEFSSSNTRSGASNKLIHPHHLSNTSRHSYFHRLPLLWNVLPIIDLDLSFATIKWKLKSYLWNHFLSNFNDDINCSFYFLFPYSRCHQSKPPTTNL